MEEGTYHIAIISDQAVRAALLSNIVVKSFEHISDVPIFQTYNLACIKKLHKPLLLLVDLMGINKISKEILHQIKEIDMEVKIIVLHLYRSTTLVNPLFKMGVDGYLYYEPSRIELKKAIQAVASEQKYIPEYIDTQ